MSVEVLQDVCEHLESLRFIISSYVEKQLPQITSLRTVALYVGDPLLKNVIIMVVTIAS